MRFILVSAVLLAQAFTTLAQHPALATEHIAIARPPTQLPYDAHSSCEEHAKAAGMCYIISSLQENSVDMIIRHAH